MPTSLNTPGAIAMSMFLQLFLMLSTVVPEDKGDKFLRNTDNHL
jgi:hypothetical protein